MPSAPKRRNSSRPTAPNWAPPPRRTAGWSRWPPTSGCSSAATPFKEAAGQPGREHHHWAFSSWMAGGGVKGGIVHGATDDHGIRVARDEVHVHDFHATILHLLGFDHEQLTYRHNGRDYRLTDVHGNVVRELLA